MATRAAMVHMSLSELHAAAVVDGSLQPATVANCTVDTTTGMLPNGATPQMAHTNTGGAAVLSAAGAVPADASGRATDGTSSTGLMLPSSLRPPPVVPPSPSQPTESATMRTAGIQCCGSAASSLTNACSSNLPHACASTLLPVTTAQSVFVHAAANPALHRCEHPVGAQATSHSSLGPIRHHNDAPPRPHNCKVGGGDLRLRICAPEHMPCPDMPFIPPWVAPPTAHASISMLTDR